VCSTFEHTHLRISDQPDPGTGVKVAFWFIGDEYMYNARWLLEIRTGLDAYTVILSIHNCDSKKSKNCFWYIIMFILIIFTPIKP
jgi:hypothetical protein